MQKNVGDLDALFRIWGGLFMLGVGINRDSTAMIAIGSGKVAEGVTRFCPMLYMMGISTRDDEINGVREDKKTQAPQAQYETF